MRVSQPEHSDLNHRGFSRVQLTPSERAARTGSVRRIPWSGAFDHRVGRAALSSHLPRRILQVHFAFLAQFLTVALSAGTAREDKGPDAKPVQEPVPAQAANPTASFARMVGGEWKMTAAAGTSMFDTWHWGPGRHSMRVMTDGLGADGNPWRALGVVYWHPGRKQVCSLGLSPYGAGVAEGAIKFD